MLILPPGNKDHCFLSIQANSLDHLVYPIHAKWTWFTNHYDHHIWPPWLKSQLRLCSTIIQHCIVSHLLCISKFLWYIMTVIDFSHIFTFQTSCPYFGLLECIVRLNIRYFNQCLAHDWIFWTQNMWACENMALKSCKVCMCCLE